MSEFRDRDWDDELRALSDVREGYRAAVRAETPPEALDAAILAASRRAVGAGPRPPAVGSLARWRAPLAAAAVLVLSVSVVWLGQDRGEAPDGIALGERASLGAPRDPARLADAAAPDGAPAVDPARVTAAGAGSAGQVAEQAAGPGSGTRARAAVPSSNDARRRAVPEERPLVAGKDEPNAGGPPAAKTGLQADRSADTDMPIRAASVASREAVEEAVPAPSAAVGTAVSRSEEARVATDLALRAGDPAVAAPPEVAEASRERPAGAGVATGPVAALRASSGRPSVPESGAEGGRPPSPVSVPDPGLDAGAAELREIRTLWATGHRAQATLALGRLLCEKPHIVIPPAFPVPRPVPSSCPDRAPSAKEGSGGDR